MCIAVAIVDIAFLFIFLFGALLEHKEIETVCRLFSIYLSKENPYSKNHAHTHIENRGIVWHT